MANVENGSADLTCQKCGASMPMGAQFCGKCGTRISASTAPSMPPPSTPPISMPHLPPPPPGIPSVPLPPPNTPPVLLPPPPPAVQSPNRGIVNLGASQDPPRSSVDAISSSAPFAPPSTPSNSSNPPWEALTPPAFSGKIKAKREPRATGGVGVRIRSHPLLVLAASILLILFSVYQILGYFISRGTGPEEIASEYVKDVTTRNAVALSKNSDIFPTTGVSPPGDSFQGWSDVAGLDYQSLVSWNGSSNSAVLDVSIKDHPEWSFSVELKAKTFSKFVFFSSRQWVVVTAPGVIQIDTSTFADEDSVIFNEKQLGSIETFSLYWPSGFPVLPGIYKLNVEGPDGKMKGDFTFKCLPPSPCTQE